MSKRLLLVAALATACTPTDLEVQDLAPASQSAAAAYTARITKGALAITGSAAASRLTLRVRQPTTLEVDVGDDGSADFSFDRSKFDRIVIHGNGGDDVVRMDESSGAFTHEELITIYGDDGNDTLLGGVGAETFYGGRGADRVDGGPGMDAIYLGAGDDVFTWDAGDTSDRVEGDDGIDSLVLNGTAIGEEITVSASGSRLNVARNIAAVLLDLDGVERVDFNASGGADHVIVGDLTETDADVVNVNLATVDGVADVIDVQGTPGTDVVTVTAAAGVATVDGLAARVTVTGGEPTFDRIFVNGAGDDVINVNGSAAADTMVVDEITGHGLVSVAGWSVVVEATAMARLAINGLGGDDTVRGGTNQTLPLVLDGGAGNDTVLGGYGAETLHGGTGDDFVDGGLGADTAFLGDGDDTFNWDPGDASDRVEGQAGSDVVTFNGASVNEDLSLSASGARVRLQRNIGAVTMDLDGVERVDFVPRGGADRLVIYDLAGTAARGVNVDLTGDAYADTVQVEGTPGVDLVDVSAEGGAVVANGLAARIAISGGDATLDRMLVNGAGADVISVSGTAATDSMQVDEVTGHGLVSVAGWSVFVDAFGMSRLAIQGLGGDDTVRAGVNQTLPLVLDGGQGNDTILGGTGVETLQGGPGNDFVDGGYGADSVFLGDGDDTFNWDPGDSSDLVEGEGGTDALVFNGSAIGEEIELTAIADRLRIQRNIAAVILDAAGFERVDLLVRAGADVVTVNDLGGTAVAQVNVDLASPLGGADGQQDFVYVRGSSGPDTIAATAEAGAVVVSGLAATTRITSPEPADILVVNGREGLDTITAGPGLGALLFYVFQED